MGVRTAENCWDRAGYGDCRLALHGCRKCIYGQSGSDSRLCNSTVDIHSADEQPTCAHIANTGGNMRKILILIVMILLTITPIRAMEFTAPTAPADVEQMLPAETESFSEGLWKIFQDSIQKLHPEVAAAAGCCVALIAVALLSSLFNAVPGEQKRVVRLVSAIAVGTILVSQSNTMVRLCVDTIEEMSEYGKLLLPVMTGALAAQGGTTGATALYAGTVAFDTALTVLITKLLIPLIYLFLALAIANAATGAELLKKLRDFLKWLMSWSLKTILYVFTGYMTITGVISGTTDASLVKATKLTISGIVPVVGGILSDASETIILSAGVMKNAVGIYGLLVIGAIWLTPFLQIGVQYLLLKLTAAVCGVFGVKEASDVIGDFSGAMGILLAMAGAVCFILLVSTICFMKGMT